MAENPLGLLLLTDTSSALKRVPSTHDRLGNWGAPRKVIVSYAGFTLIRQ